MEAALRNIEGSVGIINPAEIARSLNRKRPVDGRRVSEIVAKARELHGLSAEEVADLLVADDPESVDAVYAGAHAVKDAIYGNRLVLFAPLYISNRCVNDCAYCSFRASNRAIARRTLSLAEIADETRRLIETGHKRILLVAGETGPKAGMRRVYDAIETIYGVRSGNGEIRRLNVNIAPLATEDFRTLKACGIGTYQLFQETYHRATYARAHPRGPKADYDWRLTAIGRAFEAGIDDVGIGVLFGLADYRFEVLALLQHIRHLEHTYGVGCHTISVPRLEPAAGAPMANRPPCPVDDESFKRIVAVLRLAVPYTGIIMSTRESPAMRAATFGLGVSQISAASRTNPGGYGADDGAGSQFQLGDHRTLDEVVADVVALGYTPSFCTACYRLGRTGGDFMDLAKPGLIKSFCLPNAMLTFQEYLEDYASEPTRAAGLALLAAEMNELPASRREATAKRLERIRSGDRDLYF